MTVRAFVRYTNLVTFTAIVIETAALCNDLIYQNWAAAKDALSGDVILGAVLIWTYGVVWWWSK